MKTFILATQVRLAPIWLTLGLRSYTKEKNPSLDRITFRVLGLSEYECSITHINSISRTLSHSLKCMGSKFN